MKKKFNICVYAICKNEESFALKWAKSMSEADAVYVLDTGSTDNTVKILQDAGVKVTVREIKPWRFDTARNASLDLVPQNCDICVCTDLDELFEGGWREKLENAWSDDTQLAAYRYTWNFNDDGSEGYVFWIEKIHARQGFKWNNPVHEILKPIKKEEIKRILVKGIQLNHFADKNKPRSQYLPLLELSVKENPNDDRNIHYLGREYMYYGKWNECIATLKQHISLPSATWKDERAASMRYIAKAYSNINDSTAAKTWYLKSIAEAPYLREPYADFANFLYAQKNWEGVIFICNCALEIKERSMSYINEAASWGALPHDLKAIAYFNMKMYAEAIESSKAAIEISPNNKRLLANHSLYEKFV